MNKPTRMLIAAVAGTLLFAGCASSPPEPLNIENKVEASATVTKIDLPKRLLTLKPDAGEEVTMAVPQEAVNLPQVKVGDRVTVTYIEAIGANMRKPGDSTQETIDLGAGVAEEGQKPAGAIAAVQTLPVTIVSVDAKTHTVKFYGSDKDVRSITVQNPKAKEYVAKLKAGDEVIVTYSEAIALEVKPAGAAAPAAPAAR